MGSHPSAARLRLSAGLVLTTLLLVLASAAILLAQDQVLGVQRHEKAGVGCPGCHAEDPPKLKVDAAKCLGCHVDYPALAARTASVVPNPHAPTPHYTAAEMPECDRCHHIHAPSQDSCSGCHETFQFRTP